MLFFSFKAYEIKFAIQFSISTAGNVIFISILDWGKVKKSNFKRKNKETVLSCKVKKM